jgi:hypothetical protein
MGREDWAGVRGAMRDLRNEQRACRLSEIHALAAEGFKLDAVTPYHVRVNGQLDLFPTSGKWHDLHTNERGVADDLAAVARERLR